MRVKIIWFAYVMPILFGLLTIITGEILYVLPAALLTYVFMGLSIFDKEESYNGR